MSKHREMRLLLDFLGGPPSRTKAAPPPSSAFFSLDEGWNRVWIDAQHGVQLARESDDPPDHVVAMVSVVRGHELLVLAKCPPESGVRVNGVPAPPVVVLSPLDQLQLDSRHVLHVLLYQAASVGPVAPADIGRECAVCGLAFAEATRVWVCPNCLAPMHLQGDETPAEERLECALAARECRRCRTRVELDSGYTAKPELYGGDDSEDDHEWH